MRIWPEKTVDQEFADLAAAGHFGALNDRQFSYLRGQGLTGGLADMMFQWAVNGGESPAYSPSVLFESSEAGFWAPVTAARLWQDVARTTPVTAVGQEVASWELTSASGAVYATQATAGQRPTYQLDGDIPYLDFDGTDNSLAVPLNLSATDKATVVIGVQKDTDASLGIILEHTANVNTNAGSFYLIAAEDTTTLRYTALGRGSAPAGPAQRAAITGTGAAIDKAVISALYSVIPASNQLRRNKVAFTAATGSQGGGNYANSTLYIGRRGGTGLPFNGRIYGLIVRGAATSGTELTDAEDWINGLMSGATLDFVARFGEGSEQGSGTGAFDTKLYNVAPAVDGTYGAFSVSSGVITPDGTQTAGTYDVGGYPVEVIGGYVAVADQTEWDALSSAQAGKTILVREGAGIACATTWNNGTNFNWATVLGDGRDPRENIGSSYDSRKHFVSLATLNTTKLIFDRIRVVTGSDVGSKVSAMTFASSGAGNTVSDVQILRSVIIASRPDPVGDYSGGVTTFPGSEGISFAGTVARVSVRDNVVIGAAGGTAAIALNTVTGYCEAVGNWCDMFYGDAIRPPASAVLYGGNLHTRPLAVSTDTGNPHSDAVQFISAQGVAEACAFVEGTARGAWQSLFAGDGNQSLTVRNVFVSDTALYQITVSNLVGSQIKNCTWVPSASASFPLSNPQGGLRFSTAVSGTNDIIDSVFRASSSLIDGSVTQTGNIDAQSWLSADWTSAFPNWQMTDLPTLQDALLVHALPSSSGAAAGKGAAIGVTFSGSERSSYVLDVTTPTVSNISITPTPDGFTGTLRTDVGNNMVYYCVIPQAQGNPTWREIKERRVANAAGYGSVWCSRANAGTDLAISNNTLSPGTAYKLCAVAENGWSVRSAVTTSDFTTVAAAISRVGVGSTVEVSASSITLPIPSGSNGEYLVLFINHRDTSAVPTTPAGWTFIGNGDGWTSNTAEIAVFGKVRDGSEGSSVTVTFSTSGTLLGFAAAYAGVSGAGNQATARFTGGLTQSTPTLTATAESCILHIWATSAAASQTLSNPNPSDLVAQVYNAAGTWSLTAENQLSVSAGTTTGRTATVSGSVNWNTMQVELLKA